MAERITTRAELTWNGDLRFTADSGGRQVVIDSDGAQGPSPMQTLAMSLAGCMAIDVIDILKKGRHEVRGLRASFAGVRAATPPKKFEEIALHFTIGGDVPAHAIDRAIALSREKYCSVWHSMRESIALAITYEVER
jgi:putative redox protein